MSKEYKISPAYLKKKRNNKIYGTILFSLILLYFAAFVMIDYWYISIPITGLVIIPILTIYGWRANKKVMSHAIQCKLEILESSLVFHYPNGKTEVDCQNPQRLDVNMKSGEIESLLLTMNADNKVLISGYEKIDEIKQHFIKKVGELNVKQHRWLHKIT